jgi:serine/threonine protein kinase
MQEYCNGGSLRGAIAGRVFGEPPHGLRRRWKPLMHVAGSVADGMRYLHSQRICHGDLNPANILLKVRSTLQSVPVLACAPQRSRVLFCTSACIACMHAL